MVSDLFLIWALDLNNDRAIKLRFSFGRAWQLFS